MKGSLTDELEVSLPADEVWEVYGSVLLAELVVEIFPVISKLDVEGNGGVGTVLCFYVSGVPGMTYYKEKFVTIDDENRVKESLLFEGGFLDLGFTSYLTRFEILEMGGDSSLIKSTVEYELDEEHAASASLVTIAPVAAIAKYVSKYLLEKKAEES